MGRFSAEDQARVRSAVEAAEVRTSGEIVPVVLAAASDYPGTRPALALWGALAAFAVVELQRFFGDWPWPIDLGLGIVAAGAAAGFLLASWAPIARRVIGRERLDEAVHLRASALFLEYGIGGTSDRTGVLVVVSEFEREIEILADRGIHAKVAPGYWAGLCDAYAGKVRARGEAAPLCELIAEVGAELARHFPRGEGDRNELSDELRGKR